MFCPRKHSLTLLARDFSLIPDVLVKVIMGCDKTLTRCENIGKNYLHGLLKRKKIGMHNMDEKKNSLYKWNGKKHNKLHGIYKKKIVFRIDCLKHYHV